MKSYVRAHDVNHGLVLEKAGATAVVPETLEPSLQVLCRCVALRLPLYHDAFPTCCGPHSAGAHGMCAAICNRCAWQRPEP